MRAYPLFFLIAVLVAAPATSAQQDDKKKKADDKPPPATGSIYSELAIGGKNLAEWMKQVNDRDSALREHAVRMIGQFPSDLETKKKVIPVLVNKLSDNDAGVGASSLQSLQAFLKFEKDETIDQKDFEKLVAALTNTLTRGIASSRLQATYALGQIGPSAKSAIKPLVENLSLIRRPNELHSWELRRASAHALGRIAYDTEKGPDHSAISALLKTLKDDECAQVRLTALYSLGTLGTPKDKETYWRTTEQRTLEQVIDARSPEKDQSIQIGARVVLIKLTEANKPIPDYMLKKHQQCLDDLARILKRQSTDPEIRAQAAQALGWLGPTAKSKSGLLIEALQDAKPAVCSAAVTALGYMKSELTDGQRDEICDLMLNKEIPQETRANAALTLGSTESVAKIPKLIETLNDSELRVGDAAANALGQLKEKLSNDHLNAVAGMLNNRKLPVETRRRAAQALGLIGAKGKVADLVEALKDPDAGVANSAVAALAAMKDNLDRQHVEGIARLLQDASKRIETRCLTAQVLGMLGDKSKDFVVALIEAAKDKDLTLATTSILALARLGRTAEVALPTLARLKEHRDPAIREVATQAIDEVRGLKVKKTDPDKGQ